MPPLSITETHWSGHTVIMPPHLYHWASPPSSHFYSGEYFENIEAMDPKIVYRTTLEYSSLEDWN